MDQPPGPVSRDDAGADGERDHHVSRRFSPASEADWLGAQDDARVFEQADPQIDWALAEVLAFGSLVLEGTPVRLSGEDSGRGTFSQRHVEYHDAENDRVYVPLQHCANQARSRFITARFREYAVMGFEFGYSVADPVRWCCGRRSMAISRTARR